MELFEGIFVYATDIIGEWGYWGVVIGMAIESACIPLPSEVILPFVGYLVWQGKLNLWWASLAGAAGNLVGSWLAYWVGLYGGRPFILKYGRYFFISQKNFLQAESWFQKHGEIAVLVSRMLPIVRTFIALPAGLARMNFARFSFYTFLGSWPWSFLWIYLGMKMGEHWRELSPLFHKLDAVVIVAALGVIIYLWRKMRMSHQ
ncbi:MAG: DedA family protein [Thermincolia bacterium]